MWWRGVVLYHGWWCLRYGNTTTATLGWTGTITLGSAYTLRTVMTWWWWWAVGTSRMCIGSRMDRKWWLTKTRWDILLLTTNNFSGEELFSFCCSVVVDVRDRRVGQSGCQIVDFILSIYREVSIVVKSGQQFLFSIINVRYTLVIIWGWVCLGRFGITTGTIASITDIRWGWLWMVDVRYQVGWWGWLWWWKIVAVWVDDQSHGCVVIDALVTHWVHGSKWSLQHLLKQWILVDRTGVKAGDVTPTRSGST